MKPVLFVSDLHLAPERPQANQTFMRFLRGPVREAQALYILGDLFEYWLGDDDRSNMLNEAIIGALAESRAQGVQLFFVQGNRDFMLGKGTAKRAGLDLIEEPCEVELFGRRIVLLHGDILCTDDIAYQRYRARIRSPLSLSLLRASPLAWRRKLASSLRARSEDGKKVKSVAIMDVNREAVDALFRSHAYPLMIHGHTHRPAKHIHMVDGHRCERIVLADWYERGSYLRCTAEKLESVSID